MNLFPYRPISLYNLENPSITYKHYGASITDNYQSYSVTIPENINFFGGTFNFVTG